MPGVVQLICLELAAGAVAAAAFTPVQPVLAVTSAAALALLVAVFGRADGRWLYEGVLARWQLRRRRVLARRAAGAEASTVALATLAPRLRIRSVPDRSRSIGVGQDEGGWFAGVALGQSTDLAGHGIVRLELDQLVRILDEATVPISALQLVTYQALAPTALVEQGSAAARSYRELADKPGCPMEQATWIAVRLNPADALEAAATRGGGVEGVDRAIAAAIGRIEKALTSAGVPHAVLDADDLRDALTFSCGLDVAGEDDAPARERWVAWQAGGLVHVSFTVTDWPTEPGRDLLRELAFGPAAGCGLAVAIRPYGERVALLGLVRVVAPAQRLRVALRQLESTARRLGVRLRRLDGEQARAVYATAPTGGGVWGMP